MAYLAEPMISLFLEEARQAKEIVDGHLLYACGLNTNYREYTAKKGGYNLFDALEFAKFKRLDLYAENILSVYETLTLYLKHSFLA